MTKAKIKTPAPPPAAPDASKTLELKAMSSETRQQAYSRLLLSPSANAAVTTFHFHTDQDGRDITSLMHETAKQVERVSNGDMSRPEAMLVAQAHSLDTIFNALAARASLNMGSGHLQASETYLRMALKAQSQCRTTIEALGELKNPRTTTFNKQVNIAEQQQVNNGRNTRTSTRTGAHAGAREKKITPTTELLTEGQQHATLDTRGTGTAGGTDTGLEAVGALNRPD